MRGSNAAGGSGESSRFGCRGSAMSQHENTKLAGLEVYTARYCYTRAPLHCHNSQQSPPPSSESSLSSTTTTTTTTTTTSCQQCHVCISCSTNTNRGGTANGFELFDSLGRVQICNGNSSTNNGSDNTTRQCCFVVSRPFGFRRIGCTCNTQTKIARRKDKQKEI